MTTTIRLFPILSLFLISCVTINVYFPAAAAEAAAREIVNDVLKDETESQQDKPEPQSKIDKENKKTLSSKTTILLSDVLGAVVDLFITPVQAQTNININTPKIRSIRDQLKTQLAAMRDAFNAGQVGYTDEGLIQIRTTQGLNIRQKATLTKQVAYFNELLSQLYLEIASANGNPQWKNDIQSTFAKTWISEMSSGWMYLKNGQWLKK